MEKKNKKILSAVSFALSAVIFIFALTVFIITLNARAQNRPASLFGYSMAVVATGSMQPEINIGDLVIIKNCQIQSAQLGQNVVFVAQSGVMQGECIVHKVVEVQGSANDIRLRTKGVANDFADDDFVTAQNFVGIAVFTSGPLGAIVTFLQNPINWLYLLTIAACIAFAVWQLKRILRARKQQQTNSKSKS